MTDFRALCAELMDEAIYLGSLPFELAPDPDLIVRARDALAQPEPQGPMPEVDDILRLAAIIRRVDGNHDKGAAALAEAILSHPDSRWQHDQPEPQGPTDEELDKTLFRALCDYMEQKSPFGGPTDEKQLDRAKARAALARWGRPAIEPVAQPEMVNCHWDGPPPVPHTSVSDWFNEEGSKGILRGLRISPLPSRGGSRQGRRVGGKQ
jgi:hypothetical protein